MTRTFAVAVAAVTAASAFAGEAHAQAVTATVVAPAPAVAVVESAGTAANRPGFSVAGLAGFAFAASGYGAAFQFGARGGYTLPMHLYLGGDLGYSINSFGFFHLQGEVGYDLAVGSAQALLIRPYAGLGFVYFGGAGGGGGVCSGLSGLALQECQAGAAEVGVSSGGGGGAAGFLFSPGCVVAYDITPNFFVGGDARIPIYIGSVSTAGFDLLATGGYKF
jgi:hypothetical protein